MEGNFEIKVVGKSGQISLGKRFAGKVLRLDRLEDGSVLLTAVALVPESQLWTVAEPDRSAIERTLAWSATAPAKVTKIGRRDAKRPKTKWSERFVRLAETGRKPSDASLEEMEALWQEAKTRV